jgi:hypothetical protein
LATTELSGDFTQVGRVLVYDLQRFLCAGGFDGGSFSFSGYGSLGGFMS